MSVLDDAESLLTGGVSVKTNDAVTATIDPGTQTFIFAIVGIIAFLVLFGSSIRKLF